MYQISNYDMQVLRRATELLSDLSRSRVNLSRKERELVRMAKLSSERIGRKEKKTAEILIQSDCIVIRNAYLCNSRSQMKIEIDRPGMVLGFRKDLGRKLYALEHLTSRSFFVFV